MAFWSICRVTDEMSPLLINYVGHAETWDSTEFVGDLKAHDGLVKFSSEGRIVAVASIFRDEESLRAELDLERPS